MPASLVLAIDAGNSGCRAAVIRTDGAIECLAAREWGRPPDADDPRRIEIDLETEWSAVERTIAQAVASAPAGPVASIGVAAARSGLVVIDSAGKARAAFGPLDARATALAHAHTAGTEWPARLRSHTGQSVAVAAGPRLAWLREHDPGLLEGAYLLTLSGWLVHRLTGEAVAEPTNASTIGLLELATRTWWEEERRRWAIPPQILPPISGPDRIAGYLNRDVAASTGLPAGTPVTAGGGDTQLALLAIGAAAPGTTAIVAGSYWQIARVLGRPATDAMGRLRTTAHVAHDRWLVEARIGAPGLAARWLRDTLVPSRGTAGYDRLVEAASAVPVGSRGVLATLAGGDAGAARPPVTFDVSGRPDPEPVEAFRALLEAGAVRATAETRELDRVAPDAGGPILVGGGIVRNRLWLQVLADALGRPIRPAETADQSLLGAAMAAAVAAGAHPSIEAATRVMQRLGSAIEPDPTTSGRYEEIATRHRQLAHGRAAAADQEPRGGRQA